MFSFRSLSLLLTACALTIPAAVQAAPTETSEIKAGDRAVQLSIWRPATPKGLVIFSHGGNGSPEPYDALFERWRDAGYLVVAPLHTDSLKHPGGDHQLQTAFPTRIADVAAAQAWAAQATPGLPYAVAGHSYGSLIAMVRGGALEPMLHARDAGAKAVLAFSSPGALPGLIGPDSYRTLAAPFLIVTGDKDVVPGFVTDPLTHLAAFQTSPEGDRYAWIGKDVTHDLAGKPDTPSFAEAAALSVTFLDAYVLGDAQALATLKAREPSDLAAFKRR